MREDFASFILRYTEEVEFRKDRRREEEEGSLNFVQ